MDVITNVISANQHFASAGFSMQIVTFQRLSLTSPHFAGLAARAPWRACALAKSNWAPSTNDGSHSLRASSLLEIASHQRSCVS